MIVADTDVLIDFLRAEGSVARVRDLLRGGRLAVTAISVFEVWRGLESAAARETARRAFRGIRVYPLGVAGARRAAEVERKLRREPIGERDVLIAGTCLAVARPLLTANVRHFGRVPGLEVIAAR